MGSARLWIVLAALLCAFVWWKATRPDDAASVASASGMQPAACVLPPRVARGGVPLQSPVPDGMRLPDMAGATLTPLAGFSVEARVLGREDYHMGKETEFSPVDLALGWGRMGDDAVLAGLHISQGGRWYHYSWRDQPPIPVDEIVRSSANMHMVPADAAVKKALDRVEEGQRVRIDGWLLQIEGKDWRWRSSLTREDSGGGACEVVYVCAISPG